MIEMVSFWLMASNIKLQFNIISKLGLQRRHLCFIYGSKSEDYICITYEIANLHNGLLNLESTSITNDLIN